MKVLSFHDGIKTEVIEVISTEDEALLRLFNVLDQQQHYSCFNMGVREKELYLTVKDQSCSWNELKVVLRKFMHMRTNCRGEHWVFTETKRTNKKIKFDWDWIAVAFILAANYFLIVKHWLCFILFLIANICWMKFAYKRKIWSMIFIGVIYIVINIIGLHHWLK